MKPRFAAACYARGGSHGPRVRLARRPSRPTTPAQSHLVGRSRQVPAKRSANDARNPRRAACPQAGIARKSAQSQYSCGAPGRVPYRGACPGIATVLVVGIFAPAKRSSKRAYLLRHWCRRWESNPHETCASRDFESRSTRVRISVVRLQAATGTSQLPSVTVITSAITARWKSVRLDPTFTSCRAW